MCAKPRSRQSRSFTYYRHLHSILIGTRAVTQKQQGVVFRQASGVGKIPQLIADVLHRCSLHTHTHTPIRNNTKKHSLKECSRLQQQRCVWSNDSLVGLYLCWRWVLRGHSCCPNARSLAGTWWLRVEVRIQPWNKPPTVGRGVRSTSGSCAPDTLVQWGRSDVSGPGLRTGAGRDGDHTAPGVTQLKKGQRHVNPQNTDNGIILHVTLIWQPVNASNHLI